MSNFLGTDPVVAQEMIRNPQQKKESSRRNPQVKDPIKRKAFSRPNSQELNQQPLTPDLSLDDIHTQHEKEQLRL